MKQKVQIELSDVCNTSINPMNNETSQPSDSVIEHSMDTVSADRKHKHITFMNTDFTTYRNYRMHHSNLRKYYYGKDLTIEEADQVVNAFALINALVLTIPFNVLGNFDSSFWDWLYQNNQHCDGNSYQKVVNSLIDELYTTAYSAMTALIIALMFYILRPKNELSFKQWYRRAKWAIIVMFFATITGIIGMLTNFGSMAGWYASRSGDLCNHQQRNTNSYYTGMAVMWFFVLFCTLVMF